MGTFSSQEVTATQFYRDVIEKTSIWHDSVWKIKVSFLKRYFKRVVGFDHVTDCISIVYVLKWYLIKCHPPPPACEKITHPSWVFEMKTERKLQYIKK